MIIVASCCDIQMPPWDKVWLHNNQNSHDQNLFTLVSMKNIHVSDWQHAHNVNKALQQFENNTKLNPMKQNNLEIPDPDISELRSLLKPWSTGGKLEDEGREIYQGIKTEKEWVCACLCLCVLWSIPRPLLSVAEADQLCTVSLHGFSQGQHRQTAAIKPWLFQVHRVWKGLIEGLWSQWGWSFSPSLLPPNLPLSGGWEEGVEEEEGEECWGGGLEASRDACFLLSRPKWNLDRNTPLVAACLWVHVCHVTHKRWCEHRN